MVPLKLSSIWCRWVESALAQDAFDTIKKGSLRLAHLVRSEGLHWSAPDNKLIVVSTLQEMHDLYEKLAQKRGRWERHKKEHQTEH
eukprot:g16235.t1